MKLLLPALAVFSMAPLAASPLVLTAGAAKLIIARTPLRIGIELDGAATAAAHPAASLLLGDEPAGLVSESFDGAGRRVLGARTASGRTARVTVSLTPNQADFVVRPAEPETVLLRFAPARPGFGLADHAVHHRPSFDTDITGYRNDHFLAGAGLVRLVSNFAIYPRQRFAFLVWDPGVKIVRSTEEEVAQGVRLAEGEVRFTVFSGTPRQIYRQFLESRNLYGYPVLKPRYEFFGVGWEAFGALAWDTNHRTVTENVNRYLSEGYPLAWMVVGSGFWPREDQRFHETTSFGLYDRDLYPDPAAFISYFHSRGLKFIQGLRTTFITGGPFGPEGVRNACFVEEQGRAKIFQFAWPKSPIYLLDWHKPQAVAWFAALARKWTAYGVDGFKEDVFGFGKYELGDDKLDAVNYALKREGALIMARNAYLASAADLHRIDDFNYDQNQDRGPMNALALAYAGFPLVYPDIAGGTFGEGHFDLTVTPKMRTYIMRNAQWAALHASMSFGQGPWTFGDPKVQEVMLASARLHDRLRPYIYSQAVRFYLDGYPWTLAPLPLAFPDDPGVYGRENDRVRGYQWMMGDALLATPLYGNDYETAATRDIYLPAGTWIDYDTGERFQGPRLLKNFALPPGKTPLWVGGTGIVVEKRGGAVVARLYPVATRAETVFYHRDGAGQSTIRIQIRDWGKAAVSPAHGLPVTASWERHALEFPVKPGEDYVVR